MKLKKKILYIFLYAFMLSSCMKVDITSHRLRFPNSESRKIFIEARTIAQDDEFLANIVGELTVQLNTRGWETDTYKYQVKSVEDDPLEIEKRILSFNPDLTLEIYLTDQLVAAEYIPNYYAYGTSGAGGSYDRTASSDIELNLMNSTDGIPIWQANLDIRLSNGYFRPKLKAGAEVRRAVLEIIKAMEKDGILYTLAPRN